MRVLASDTTTASASVCVMEGERVLASRFRNPGETHSRHLLAMLEGVLEEAGLGVRDLDAVACTVGPGSFTGLRIGISTMKGLAMAAGLPMFGFSSLEVLAARFIGCPVPVCAMMDARRKEVYAQFFRVSAGKPEPLGAAVAADPAEVLVAIEGQALFVGSGAMAYRKMLEEKRGEKALWPGILHHDPDARETALLALHEGLAAALPPHRILPVYLRKSDAELQWRQG